MYFRKSLLLIVLFTSGTAGFAQQRISALSPAVYSADKGSPKQKDPKKATVLSAILPGLGQAYNGKYWKMPIIYAGMGGLAYGIAFNQKQKKDYETALTYRFDNDTLWDPKFGNLTGEALVYRRNQYRNFRDLCIVGTSLVYVLQIVDAAVDAHLSGFDMNRSLSMKVYPGKVSLAYRF